MIGIIHIKTFCTMSLHSKCHGNLNDCLAPAKHQWQALYSKISFIQAPVYLSDGVISILNWKFVANLWPLDYA